MVSYTEHTGQAQGGPAARLGQVTEKFDQFYLEIEQEREHRRAAEAERFQQLHAHLASVEQRLQEEVDRRKLADLELRAWLTAQLQARAPALGAAAERSAPAGLAAEVAQLGASIQGLQQGLREERQQRAADLAYLAQQVAARADACDAAVQSERVARLEAEAASTVRLSAQLDSVSIEACRAAQRVCRQEAAQQIQAYSQSDAGTSRAMEQLEGRVAAELATLRRDLQAEREERIGGEDHIVAAINDYTRALQDGLRIVGSS